MNKGLYKSPEGYLLHLKTWKNSSENSGYTLSLHSLEHVYQKFKWTNADTKRNEFSTFIGAACLAQW